MSVSQQEIEHLRYIPIVGDDEGYVEVKKIVAAVQRIVELAAPVRVVAFGSRARRDHRVESDLDLAVVVDSYDPQKDRRPIWRSQIPVLMPIDLIVYDSHRESEMGGSLNSLQFEVAKEGVVLYERSEGVIDLAAAERLV